MKRRCSESSCLSALRRGIDHLIRGVKRVFPPLSSNRHNSLNGYAARVAAPATRSTPEQWTDSRAITLPAGAIRRRGSLETQSRPGRRSSPAGSAPGVSGSMAEMQRRAMPVHQAPERADQSHVWRQWRATSGARMQASRPTAACRARAGGAERATRRRTWR